MAAPTESSAAESSFSEEVSKLMGQGKRHLVCSEVLQAVKCFEEATQKLDGQYGSGSDECGEAYLFYGKALLELAR
ncbi:protein HGV2-like [Orbicella faveolata]|uniref:protein HGV2-like n=1 Tax=Orbicella faveolata TaxID=48498 RepID=UPI0009E3FFEC|nr:protein HGV2-like [Orbicella faveolata]